jgi:hypothetical protein
VSKLKEIKKNLGNYTENPDQYIQTFREVGQNFFFFFIFLLLFICAYKAWFISPPCPHPLPYHPLRPLPLPPPSIPSRNYFALSARTLN